MALGIDKVLGTALYEVNIVMIIRVAGAAFALQID
jgi:hypothetical protein